MSRLASATTIPVTHAAKQKNSRRSPRSIGISRLPYTSPVLRYLDAPSFGLRSIPDSRAITNYFMPASRTRLPGHIALSQGSLVARGRRPMPIRPFLNGEQFDQETVRILGVAFEQVCIGLRTGNKIIELAKTGERNPDLLCERALKGIREPQVRPGDAFSPVAAGGIAEKTDQ